MGFVTFLFCTLGFTGFMLAYADRKNPKMMEMDLEASTTFFLIGIGYYVLEAIVMPFIYHMPL